MSLLQAARSSPKGWNKGDALRADQGRKGMQSKEMQGITGGKVMICSRCGDQIDFNCDDLTRNTISPIMCADCESDFHNMDLEDQMEELLDEL